MTLAATWTTEDFKSLCDDFGQRLAQDEGFRSRALADAPAALRELAGRELPPDSDRLKLTQTPQGLMLAAEAREDLSDAELESVVGGMSLAGAAASVLLGAVAGGAMMAQSSPFGARSASDQKNAIIFGVIMGAGAGAVAAADVAMHGG